MNQFVYRKYLRHWLMVNLSMSDLLLCLVTMPLTFMETVSHSWPLGNYPVLCKLAGSFEAMNTFCSTLTIVAIAVDRYMLVVQSRSNQPKSSPFCSILIIFCIWLVIGVLACPLFIFRTLIHIPLSENINKLLGISSVYYCYEDWPAPYWSLIYSTCSLVFLCLIPILVITLAHTSICARLSSRFRHNNPNNKTLKLLIAIAATFVCCWLPLNLYNLMDSAGVFLQWNDEFKWTLFALCHLIGMSSACINPILYGWFNSTLREDLTIFFSPIFIYFGFGFRLSTREPTT